MARRGADTTEAQTRADPAAGDPNPHGGAKNEASAGADAASSVHATGEAPLGVHATGAAPLSAQEATGEAPRLVLIGAGHVFRIDAAIRGAIHALRPDAVFVELDKGRLEALLHRERTGTSPARGGFVHTRLQRFQEGVAQLYGAKVGNEMLAAVQASREVGARLGLIDAPGEETVKRALSSLTAREKLRAVGQLVGVGVKRLLPQRKDAREAMEAEVRRYEQDPDAALQELRNQYPTVWRVLIDERDERMADAIRQAMQTTRLGVAVLGDGHVPGVLRRLRDLDVTVYRLTDVRQGRLPSVPAVAFGSSDDVSFGFDVRVDGTGGEDEAPDADADTAAEGADGRGGTGRGATAHGGSSSSRGQE